MNTLDNIPHEMRAYAQWVVWRFEDAQNGKPTKVPYCAHTGRLASVSDPSTWCTFDQARAVLEGTDWYNGLGFVLTAADPYTFIDLDDAEGDDVVLQRQLEIYNEFEGYAERSPSGKGLHIIIRAEIPSGRRRSKIEIYSTARYMTMTGDVYRESPIYDCNEKAQTLWQQMGTHKNLAVEVYAGLTPEKQPDDKVFEVASAAANGQKFIDLYNGDWQKYYPSQSEADFALIDIIAYYTQNRAQIKRMFQASALGNRDKAKREDYINYMLNKCFDRMLPPINTDFLKQQIDEVIEAKNRNAQDAALGKEIIKNDNVVPVQHSEVESDFTPRRKVYELPPGLLGEIAQFIYAAAPRPVPEIALAGAIGFMAGLAGRAYNVSATGLNQYVLLLAPTGTGKEAIAKGIDKIVAQVVKTQPHITNFIGPSQISSAQAALKYMSKGPTSFVSIVGEFGLYLQQMGHPNAPSHLKGLRSFILDAYNKSGSGQIIRPAVYSDSDKNTLAIKSPAFSIVGESTPEKFYEGLHEGLINEGLLPRFTVIEYMGDRPALNEDHFKVAPSFDLIEKVTTLCSHASMLNSQNKVINVDYTADALELMRKFDKHCDDKINKSERDIMKQIWSRAHMKALKMAALVAVGVNPYNPIIDETIAKWGINIAYDDAENFINRFMSGSITSKDNDEDAQIMRMFDVIRGFITTPWHQMPPSIAATEVMHKERVMPYALLHRACVRHVAFKNDKLGATAAIKRTIDTLIQRGDLVQLSPKDANEKFNTSGRLFMLKNMFVLDKNKFK